MRKFFILIVLYGGGFSSAEQLLKLPGGGDILVRKEGTKLIDCRGKEVRVKGQLVSTDDRCPDQQIAGLMLPRTASEMPIVLLGGVILTRSPSEK